jgi:hypothetical protein
VVGDGGVGRGTLREPERARVEGVQRARARLHVREAANPDEAVRVREVAELAQHVAAFAVLALDEVCLEEVDEGVAHPRVLPVLPELVDGEARRRLAGHTVILVPPRGGSKSQFRRNA